MLTLSDIFTPLSAFLDGSTAADVLRVLIDLSPIILAMILFQIFWPLWVRYVRAEFFYKQKYTVAEIKLPKETLKSPLAMELFLTALHQTGGEGNAYDKFWLGKTRPWFSLEMVSVEGQVKFFIWMRSTWKGFIESSLYAQFPGIEVHDVDDYARSMHFDPQKMTLWGCELEFTKKDFYPIKTYVDYKLDKDPKEEFKVDPLAPLLEFLGSIGANQQVWIQILVRAHKAEDRKPGHIWKKTDKMKDEAIEEINKILVRDPKTKVTGKIDEESGKGQQVAISEGEKEIVAAIERSLTKQAYDVGIRAMYIAKKEFFNPANISGLTGSFKQFGSEHLNGFKPNGSVLSPKFSYPWQDYKEFRQNRMREEAVAAYKRRSYFFGPFKAEKSMVLNSEELATIFHFPGQVAQTPTLSRIPSKKAEAPGNLPV
ncbi:hypothetical protein EB052_01655 [bacterium]|nr:hypothetical protein [bacterium]